MISQLSWIPNFVESSARWFLVPAEDSVCLRRPFDPCLARVLYPSPPFQICPTGTVNH